MFVSTIAKNDIVADASVSISAPFAPVYGKVGASKVISIRKNIDQNYLHAGAGVSTPSLIPITLSYSVGVVKNVNKPSDYAGPFIDMGFGSGIGYDFCFWPGGSRAHSITFSTNYGAYFGGDYYWSIGD